MTLIEAIQANNEKVFFELLNLRVNPLEKRIIDDVDAECAGNALYWAAACGYLHFIGPLVKGGVNVNKPNRLGWTPVYAAAHFGYAEIITTLKTAGADVNTPDDSGTTPVCAAAYGGHAKAVTALKAAGADINATEVNGLTPLYIAVQNGDLKVIRVLLEARAHVHIRTPHGTALDLARGSTTLKDKDIVVKLLEAHQTTLGFKEAEALTQLKEGYSTSEYSTISGIFGRPLTLERQYINLQILCTDLKTKKPEANQESKESAEAKPIENYKDARMASIEDLFGDKRVIKAEDLFKPTRELFNNQVLEVKPSDEVPRLLLVQGRAGIGKTTFVRYVAHQWSRGQLYTNYTWVFTLTLRKLRLLPKTPELSLSEWIRLSQFSDWSTKEFDELWQQSIEGAIHQNQVLLILDGYDETPEEHPCQSILEQLLSGSGRYAKLNFLITTRPVSAEKISQKRRNLEIIGFTDANINEYIQSYFESSEEILVNTFTEALRKQPIIWANAHIPLNLNLLCGIMEEAIQKAQADGLNQALAGLSSMTRLYQVMEKKLYERSYTRRDAVLPNVVRLHIRAASDFTQHYEKERLFLAKLAFQSFESERIIISLQAIGDTLAAYVDKEALQNQQQKEALGDAFFKTVCELGLIKPVLDKSGLSQTKQDYEFLHLTFQEYYTAIYIASRLSSKESAAQTFAQSIIAKEKYNPRWQIVWWFVAGLLRENTPVYQAYLQQLQGESTTQKDIFEHYPLGLLTRCIDEGFSPQNQQVIEPIVKQLQSSFLKLYQIAKSVTNNGENPRSKLRLVNSPFFSACRISPNLCMSESQDLYTLILESKQPKDRHFLSEWVGAIRVVTPKALDALLGLLVDENKKMCLSAANVLRKLGAAVATPKVLSRLVELATHENSDVRYFVASALQCCTAVTPKVLNAFVRLLADEDRRVGDLAVEALNKLGTAAATPEALTVFVKLLTHESRDVRRSATEVLGNLGKAAAMLEVLEELERLVVHKNSDVRHSAIEVLSKLGVAAARPEILRALTTELMNFKSVSRYSAAEAVLKLGAAVAPEVWEALAKFLVHQDRNMRCSAAEMVCRLGASTATPRILETLLELLEDKDSRVRRYSAKALGTAATMPEMVKNKLLQLSVKDNSFLVRYSAADTLNKFDCPLIAEKLVALLGEFEEPLRKKWRQGLLPDENWQAVKRALDELGEASAILFGLLHHKNSSVDVRRAAAWTLSNHNRVVADSKTLHEFMGLLADKDSDVRDCAVKVLGESEMDSHVLLQLLKHKENNVRYSAAKVASKLGLAAETPEILGMLLGLLEDEDSRVRCCAAEALGNLGAPAATPQVLKVLGGLLEDKELSVRLCAMLALSTQTRLLSTETRLAFSTQETDNAISETLNLFMKLLVDKDSDLRRSAAKALGNLGEAAAKREVLDTLAMRLLADKEDRQVRSSVAKALDKLSNVVVPKVFLEWLLEISSAVYNNKVLDCFEMRIETVFTLLPSFWSEHVKHHNILAFLSYALGAAYLNSQISCEVGFVKEGASASYYVQVVARKLRNCFLVSEEQAKTLLRLSSLVIEQLSKTGKLDIVVLKKQLSNRKAMTQSLKRGGVIMNSESVLEQKGSSLLTQYRQSSRESEARSNQKDVRSKCRIS